MKNIILEMINKIKENRIVKNLLVLLSGDVFVSAIGIINLSLVLKTIGLDGNGIIIMVQTYCLLFNDIFNFQSFNALIKYLPDYILRRSIYEVKGLIKQSFFLDAASAVLATVAGYIFIIPVASFMHWDKTIVVYIYIYLITILFNITGTSTGILRSYNKFALTTYINIFASSMKFVLYLIGFAFKKDFIFFIFVEMTLDISRNILLIVTSYNVLKKEGLQDFYKVKLKFDRQFFSFNFYSNIAFSLDIPVRHLTTFVIDKYMGVESISIYRIFQKLGSIVEKVGVPLSQIIYPEITAMVAKGDYKEAFKLNKKIIKISSICGGVILLGTAITYKLWLWLFIDNYQQYILLFLLYLTYIVISYCGVGLHAMFMALGYIKYTVPILLIINPIYIILLIVLTINFGLLGVIISLAIQTLAILLVKSIIVSKFDKSK